MHVGYDARILASPRRTGIGNYAFELISALGAAGAGDRFTLYYPRGSTPCRFAGNVKSVVGPVSPEFREDRFFWLWYDIYLPLRMCIRSPDIFHGPSYLLPSTRRVKTVVTVLDLAHERFPELALGCSPEFASRARRNALDADAVIAISDRTRRDVIELYGVDESRVRVIYLGVDDRFRPVGDGAAPPGFRERYGLPDNFVLSVISLHPRKNLPRLLRAFKILKEKSGLPHKLAVTGKDYGSPELRMLVEDGGLADSFLFLDYFPDEDLPLLYGAADAFVFPSLYEGFGLPPVEAMACGTPVVASRAGSLPEVLGDAALYFDPLEPEEMAALLEKLLSSRDETGRLRRLGLERAGRYRWDDCARRTRALYDELLA